MMVNITATTIDSKGRIQLPKTFLIANNLRYGKQIIIKPLVNKINSVALIWEKEDAEQKS